MNSPTGAVLQLCGDAVGGIRKHVHSILLGASASAPRYAYAYSAAATDERFHQDLAELSRKTDTLLPLKIRKRPALGDIGNLWQLARHIRRHDIRVVHAHGAKAGVYGRALRPLCNVRVLYTPHGGVLHSALRPLEEKLYLTAERLLLPLTDRVVVESDYSRQKFIEKIGKPACPLVINYNGVAPEPGDAAAPAPTWPTPRGAAFRIGVFARIFPMKGVDIAIRTCAALAGASGASGGNRLFELHVFGGGERAELEKLTTSLGCAALVHFHGDVASPIALMPKLDVVLVPSRFESFSYVAAEAQMMRVPVVAAAVGGLREVLAEDAGLLVPQPEAADFAAAIRRLADDPAFAAALAQRGHERQQRLFSQARMVDALEAIYRELLHDPQLQQAS